MSTEVLLAFVLLLDVSDQLQSPFDFRYLQLHGRLRSCFVALENLELLMELVHGSDELLDRPVSCGSQSALDRINKSNIGGVVIYVFVFLDESEERVNRIMCLSVRPGPNLIVCKGIIGFSIRGEPCDKESFKELCEGADKTD